MCRKHGSSKDENQDDDEQKHAAADIHFRLLLVARPCEAQERELHLTTRERRGLFDGARSATGQLEQQAVGHVVGSQRAIYRDILKCESYEERR